jgi:hypothetical protein
LPATAAISDGTACNRVRVPERMPIPQR